MVVVGSLAVLAGTALAEVPFVAERAVIVGRVGDAMWTDAATEARSDQPAELAPVVIGHRGRKRVVLTPAGVDKIKLHGSRIATESLPDDTRVQWSVVEPHGFRVTPSKVGATSDFYSNVSTESATFGRWLGFDSIDYGERVVRAWADVAPIAPEVTSDEANAIQVPGIGTIRYKLEVELPDGVHVTSPGAESTDEQGVTPAVHRVSIRQGDDFLGYLSEYLLVPEVFGSAGGGNRHQTERFTGADCADVMVGAMRRKGKRLAYTNVAGLPAYTHRIAPATELDDTGAPATPIIGVQAGDLIRIDYGGELRHHTPRDWDHVAALWEDRSDPHGPFHGGPDGLLDGFDLVIHMGHPRLLIEPLADQAPATVDVLRWR